MQNFLAEKKILIGITGGIAAYKAGELIRLLRHAGAQVQAVVTPHAKEFITPMTLETLSGRPVYSDLFDRQFESDIGHIQLSRWADLILIAPASAHFLARLAHGLADDLLTTLCLATRAPIVVAPAMNQYMWQNIATQENVHSLKNRGIQFIGPDIGEQACGDHGMGRLVEPLNLLTRLESILFKGSNSALFGKKVLITTGPTHEAIDPVRYISTRSSGYMGCAIANSMVKSGAKVILVSGPSSLPCPPGVTKIEVVSAEDMHRAVMENLPCDIFIGAAAVSDYRPEFPATTKIKRHSDSLSLALIKNPDILYSVKKSAPQTFIVGFAAETDNHLKNAKEKLQKKQTDILVLNSVEAGKGFGIHQKNSITILTRDADPIVLPELDKDTIAARLTSFIAHFFTENVTTSP